MMDPRECRVYALSGLVSDHKDAYGFLERFRREVGLDAGPVIVDLTQVTHMTSCGVGILAAAYGSALNAGRAMALVGLGPRLQSLLRVVGLVPIIPCYETCDEAVAAMSTAQAPGDR